MNKFFHLYILNARISVSNRYAINPVFMDWTEAATQRNLFNNQPDAITFTTLSSSGECLVHVRTADKADPVHHQATKVAFVSFSVGPHGIMISGVNQPVQIDLNSGNYRLVFNAIPGQDSSELDTYEFIFVKSDEELFE